MAFHAPKHWATAPRVIPPGPKYAQEPWEGSKLPPVREMDHSIEGKPGYYASASK